MKDDFSDLVEKHHKLVLSLIRRYYGGDLVDEIEDLAQDIWLKLWDNFHKNEKNIVNFKSYLYRTVQTTLWDAVRTLEKKRRETGIDEEEQALFHQSAQSSDRKLELDLVLRALAGEERRIVKAYIQGFNNGEIADLVGCNEGRVRNLIFRLKKRLHPKE